MDKLRSGLLLLLLAAFLMVPALTQPIEETGHDSAVVHIYRAVLFSEAISDGVLYPRWVQQVHLGLGGPLFTFQSPLPYYALDVLYRLGVPHPIGWRVLMAGGVLVAGVGMYLLLHHLTRRRWPAVAGAMAYLYAPYMIRDLFDRGSNEVYSLFLYPWVIWALLRLAAQPSAARFALAALLWAACIGAHVLGPLMLAPIVGLLALALFWQKRTPLPLLALVAGGFLMAFVWLPMIPERGNIHLDWWRDSSFIQPAESPIPLDALLAPPTLYDVMRDNNKVGDRVGWVHLLVMLLAPVAMLLAWRAGRRDLAMTLLASTLGAWGLFWLLTDSSTPLWHLFAPLLQLLEFRMRLLGLLALAVALLFGAELALLPTRWQRPLSGLAVALLLLTSISSLYVELMHRHGAFGSPITPAEVRAAELRLAGNSFTSFGENTPQWAPRLPGPEMAEAAVRSPLAAAPAGVEVMDVSVETQRWHMTVSSSSATTLTLHLLYYPRWEATVEGEKIPLSPEATTGLTQLAIPAGTHRIALRYARPVAEWLGLALSMATLLGLVGAVGMATRRGQNEATPVAGSVPTGDNGIPLWLLGGVAGLLLVKLVIIDPATTWFRCVSTIERVCGAQQTVNVPYAGGPRLRGYTLPTPTLARGETLVFTLIWQGDEATNRAPLHTFVHLMPEQEEGWPRNPANDTGLWAQVDHQVPGDLLTTNYLPDRLYWDEFRIEIPRETPRGNYRLRVGWYDPQSGEQLVPNPASIHPPLAEHWRAIFLPSITIR
ncbi:MAG: hypothetical protein H0T73_09150 [Ardenticatenales bacterium]|nr:hypothetical protein [Ardenticatenales bacterium]